MKKVITLIMALGVMLMIGNTALAVLSDGLVAYYTFNGNADDESGNGNHGTVYGATLATDRFWNANSAYRFDGVDDYVDVPVPTSISHTEDFSWGAWIRTSSLAEYQWIIGARESEADADAIGFFVNKTTGIPYAMIRENGADAGSFVGSAVIADGNWHYVVLVRDTEAGQYKIYVDATFRCSCRGRYCCRSIFARPMDRWRTLFKYLVYSI